MFGRHSHIFGSPGLRGLRIAVNVRFATLLLNQRAFPTNVLAQALCWLSTALKNRDGCATGR